MKMEENTRESPPYSHCALPALFLLQGGKLRMVLSAHSTSDTGLKGTCHEVPGRIRVQLSYEMGNLISCFSSEPLYNLKLCI